MIDRLKRSHRYASPTHALAPAYRHANRREMAGFSVLELIFAIVVASVFYTIALPAIARTRVSASVHNSRHVVVSSISLARATAMRYGRPAVLRLDVDRERIWVEADTTLAGGGAALDTLGMFHLGLEYDVDLKSNRGSLCFDGRGIGMIASECPLAGAAIIVTLRDRADTVLVSALGRVVER